MLFHIISCLDVINIAEQDPKQEGEKFFTETSKSQMQSLLATGAATVAILTTLSMGRSDAQQVLLSSGLYAMLSSHPPSKNMPLKKVHAATELNCIFAEAVYWPLTTCVAVGF